MEKQKKSYVFGFIALILMLIVNIVLFATNVFKFWLFLVIVAIILAVGIFLVFKFIKLQKMIKLAELKKNAESSGDYNVDLYTILGIPFQYNDDGTVKNIYELLGLEPMYDEKGNRIMTVYEQLGVMPKFDSEGNEIPLVFSIKNRVGRIARVDLNSRVLTRKLSEEEKEYLAIKEALQQKMQEAEQNGNKPMQEAIKKIIEKTETKKKKEEDKGSSPPKYKFGKSSGAVKSDTPKEHKVKVETLFANASKNKDKKKDGASAGNNLSGKNGDGKKTGDDTKGKDSAVEKTNGTVESGNKNERNNKVNSSFTIEIKTTLKKKDADKLVESDGPERSL